MSAAQPSPANVAQPAPGVIALSGGWTARTLGDVDRQLDALTLTVVCALQVDGTQLEKIDSIGMWVLQRHLKKLRDHGAAVELLAWPPEVQKLMEVVSGQDAHDLPMAPSCSPLERLGRKAVSVWFNTLALLSFIGETALTLVQLAPYPQRWRWRPVLHNIQTAGFQALPIVGVTSFLLGIVIAYQGADQLKHYGANIFVVELLGYSMLREFAPLITAIIIAGRSGSAYAAQIGTMVVTEEIDAMRTIGIKPIDVLVLPKIIGLLVALPLLTIFADAIGILGGMVMARSQLDIGYADFIDRFGNVMHLSAFMIGIGKALVFSIVISVIGCFQGFRTQPNADSVGRQTTRSVVQSIFMVIVLDAIFSVIFSILDL